LLRVFERGEDFFSERIGSLKERVYLLIPLFAGHVPKYNSKQQYLKSDNPLTSTMG